MQTAPLAAPGSLANALFEHCRSVGLERGFELSSRLIYLCWELLATDQGRVRWQDLMELHPADQEQQVTRELVSKLRDLPGGQLDVDRLLRLGSSTPLLPGLLHIIDRALDHPQPRDNLVAVFEALLDHAGFAGLARSGEHGTPHGLAALMAAVLGGARSVFDPVCGLGSTLLAFGEREPLPDLHGADLNLEAVSFAAMRTRMAGIPAAIHQGDVLRVAQDHLRRHDAVVMHPPWGMQFPREAMDQLMRLGIEPATLPRSTSRSNLVWVEIALRCLQVKGRAAVLLPPSAVTQPETVAALLDRVEVVISLPPKVLRNTSLPAVLLVLTETAEPERSILMVDASSFTEPSSRDHLQLSLQEAARIGRMVADWRRSGGTTEPDHVAKSISSRAVEPHRGLQPSSYLAEAPQPEVALPTPAHHLLSHVVVGGFKSFAEPQVVPLAPLTLIYGANSSGKSTLLQSLLLLRQSRDAESLTTQGPAVNVGSFVGAKHKHGGAPVRLGAGFGAPVWQLPPAGTPDPSLPREVIFSFGSEVEDHGLLDEVRVAFGPYASNWKRDGDATFRSPMEQVSPVFVAIASGTMLHPFDARQIQDADTDKEAQLEKSRQSQGRQAGRTFEKLGVKDFVLRWNGLFPSDQPVYGPTLNMQAVHLERNRSVAKSYGDRFARLTAGVGAELATILEGLTYLGPLRSAPQRFYDRANTQAQVGDGRHIALYLYDNTTVARTVNDWLRTLEVPYELDVVPVQVAGATQLVGDLVAVTLTDVRSRVTVTPADVGFGISQVLPIVVELSARRDSVILVEQPETHLHPRLQARLADLFIDSTSVAGRGNQLIVETHSEHVLLRVQRRIREGSLTSDDVAVIYVDQDESGVATVQRLRLDGDGDFLDEWPSGFFDDRLDELLGGLG